MTKLLIRTLLTISTVRLIPHLFIYFFHNKKLIIRADTIRWLNVLKIKMSILSGFIFLLSFYPEFRNVFYLRIGKYKYFLNLICPKLKTLIFSTDRIGEGLFIEHGFSTSVGAKSIGKNCWINQQVTIGDYHLGTPIILDNVSIRSGATIIGNITIGNNVVIGANAIVYTDVPDNCTVFASPSRIIYWKKPSSFKSQN